MSDSRYWLLTLSWSDRALRSAIKTHIKIAVAAPSRVAETDLRPYAKRYFSISEFEPVSRLCSPQAFRTTFPRICTPCCSTIANKRMINPGTDAAWIYLRYTSIFTLPCSLCSFVVLEAGVNEIPVTTGLEKLVLREAHFEDKDSSSLLFDFSSENVPESVFSSEAVVPVVFGVEVPELVSIFPWPLLRS